MLDFYNWISQPSQWNNSQFRSYLIMHLESSRYGKILFTMFLGIWTELTSRVSDVSGGNCQSPNFKAISWDSRKDLKVESIASLGFWWKVQADNQSYTYKLYAKIASFHISWAVNNRCHNRVAKYHKRH